LIRPVQSSESTDALGSCDYDVLWNAFKVFAKGYSADEKTALFSGTAAKVYECLNP
jgi:predicted TIM-barrel fold metal-dependent hydrolase